MIINLDFSNKNSNYTTTIEEYLKDDLFLGIIEMIFEKHNIKINNLTEVYSLLLNNDELFRDFLDGLKELDNISTVKNEKKKHYKNINSEVLQYIINSLEKSKEYGIEKFINDINKKVADIVGETPLIDENILLYKYGLPFEIKINGKDTDIISTGTQTFNIKGKKYFEVLSSEGTIYITQKGNILKIKNKIVTDIDIININSSFNSFKIDFLGEEDTNNYILYNNNFKHFKTENEIIIKSFLKQYNYGEGQSLYEVLTEDNKIIVINQDFITLRNDNVFDILNGNNKISYGEPFDEIPKIIKFNDNFLISLDSMIFSDYGELFKNSFGNQITQITVNKLIKWDDNGDLMIVKDNVNGHHYINKDYKVLTHKGAIINNIPQKSGENIEIFDIEDPKNPFINIEKDSDTGTIKERVRKKELKFI